MSFSFNAKEHLEAQTPAQFKLWEISNGTRCFVMAAQEVVTQNNDSAITVLYKALDGVNTGRENKHYFMMTCHDHKTKVAKPDVVARARSDLASLCMACGVAELSDLSVLNGHHFLLDVGMYFNKKTNSSQNTFRFNPLPPSQAAYAPPPNVAPTPSNLDSLDDVPF